MTDIFNIGNVDSVIFDQPLENLISVSKININIAVEDRQIRKGQYFQIAQTGLTLIDNVRKGSTLVEHFMLIKDQKRLIF